MNLLVRLIFEVVVGECEAQQRDDFVDGEISSVL